MRFKIAKNLILQKMEEGLVGFDAVRSSLYTFNETAEFIFKKIKAGWNEEKIVLALLRKYDVNLPTLKKDVRALMKDLIKNKIISPTRSRS